MYVLEEKLDRGSLFFIFIKRIRFIATVLISQISSNSYPIL